MAHEITYNNFEISLTCGIYAKYHYKSCYYLCNKAPIYISGTKTLPDLFRLLIVLTVLTVFLVEFISFRLKSLFC